MPSRVRGDVVTTPFPNTHTRDFKARPALVLASWEIDGVEDVLLCLISASATNDPDAIPITPADLIGFRLNRPSRVRPRYVYVAKATSTAKQGRVTPEFCDRVMDVVRNVVR